MAVYLTRGEKPVSNSAGVNMKEVIVFCTVDSEELAEQIAFELVNSHAAACVNIVSGIRSVYRWKGELCQDVELLLVIKSVAEKFEAVRETIRSIHTYKVPEVIAVPIAAGDADYLNWLRASVS
jgi:periplasmic divalent cation tolerance protein